MISLCHFSPGSESRINYICHFIDVLLGNGIRLLEYNACTENPLTAQVIRPTAKLTVDTSS